MLKIPDGPAVIDAKAMYNTMPSNAAIFAYPTCIRRPSYSGDGCRNIAITFGTEKLECCGYPTVKKI